MRSDIFHLGITEAAALIAGKALSPVELTDACIARIEAFNPSVRAFITLTADAARESARTAEAEIMAGRYRGPMHGIPFGLKDIFNTAGILTTGSSRLAADNVPAADATAARKLAAAGGILLGKLATWEFAHGVPDPDLPWPSPRNPWDLDHTTSGSSSGSAAAVAAGFLPCALGTDTGGSIRGPAALTGVVGLKPTYGLVSRSGMIPNSFSFDHCGPLTWTVEDAAIVLQAIAGFDPSDPGSAKGAFHLDRGELSQGVRGMRIGVPRHFWEEDLAVPEETVQALDEAVGVLRDLGAEIEVVRMPSLQRYYDVKTIIAESEIFAVHQHCLATRLDVFGKDFLRRTVAGCLFTAPDYVQAQRERRRIIVETGLVFDRCRVLLTCGTGPAPRADARDAIDYRNKWSRPNLYTPFNVLGGPALSLCNGYSAQGLPLAMQLAGQAFDDMAVLRVGHAFEAATRWRDRRPSIAPSAAGGHPETSSQPASRANHEVRGDVQALLRRAGIRLPADLLEDLCEIAPAAFAMAARIRRDSPWNEEPANVFRLAD